MRFLVLAATVGAAVVASLTPAPAQAQRYGYGHNGREVRQEQRECRRELRHARSRWEYQRELRECRREISRARAGYRDGWRGDDRRWSDRRRWEDRRRHDDRRGGYYRRY
jgi:hypothetical protein